MIKFKRLNTIQHARENATNKLDFYCTDILRQTTLAKIIDIVGDKVNKKQLINYTLNEIEKLLNEMIVEK